MDLKEIDCEVDVTGSELCPAAGLVVSGAEPSASVVSLV
jgi:hypothetical protein